MATAIDLILKFIIVIVVIATAYKMEKRAVKIEKVFDQFFKIGK